ncbi:MAG: acyl-CoA dehydrogenase, partial [Betaproteobacteria bacterium]
MDFQYQSDNEAMQDSLRKFMARHVLPANQAWHRQAGHGAYPTAVVEPLKALARQAGFWNLFLPGLRDDE